MQPLLERCLGRKDVPTYADARGIRHGATPRAGARSCFRSAFTDVDLVGGRISVDRSLISVGYELHETPGKTRTARRSIDIDSSSVAVLDRWLQLRRDENPAFRRESDDYVFAHRDGSPIHPQVLSDAFEKLVKRSGLPRIRFHDLRHTHATLLLKARVPIKVVSERLGHSTPGFTMATYQQVLPGMQADAARTFSALLEPLPISTR